MPGVEKLPLVFPPFEDVEMAATILEVPLHDEIFLSSGALRWRDSQAGLRPPSQKLKGTKNERSTPPEPQSCHSIDWEHLQLER